MKQGAALAVASAALAATPLLQPRLAIWVGNEARGLSAAALGALELLVTIPMAGMVESLNVSCCAAVMVAVVAHV